MRVVMISKALVVESYRAKLRELAAHPDVDLTAIVPRAWPEAGQLIPYRPGGDETYRTLVEPILFTANFHLHFYPRLWSRLRPLRPHILHVDEEPFNLVTFLAVLAGKRVG